MDHTTPCMCCHATLWNNNARKQAITDKLQGNVATYVRYGGDANNQFNKCLLLSLSMKKNKIGEYFSQSYKQELGCLVHFVHLATTLLKDEESARDNTFLLVTLPYVYRF